MSEVKEQIRVIIDERERALFSYLTPDVNLTYSIATINVGDFQIVKNDKIVAVIERKTLKDYAASIKDGRTGNLVKLTEARELTNCQIFYIIEGPMRPQDTTRFGGMPYKSIRNSITRLMIMHDVHVLHTKGPEDTIAELVHLCGIYAEVPITGGSLEPLASIKKSDEQKLIDARSRAWATVAGISVRTGYLLSQQYTLSQLLGGNLDLSEFILPSGRKMTATAISAAHTPFIKLVLAECPGLSDTTAAFILQDGPVVEVSGDIYTCVDLSKRLKTEKMKVGKKLAIKIKQFLDELTVIKASE